MSEMRNVADLVWRDDLYPRFETQPAKVQEYAKVVNLLPPVEVNQHNELIDGWHRWTAHRKAGKETIEVTVTPTESEADLLAFAYERNSHGVIAITPKERKHGAIRMYADGTGRTEEEIASLLHVEPGTVRGYLARTKKENKKRRNQRIWDTWLACVTYEEIAEQENISHPTAMNVVENCKKSETMPKLTIFSEYRDPKWKPPLYDVWKTQNKSNETSHPGNSEAQWLDNLVYMYTEPFDIVVDPFGGGGSTIDVCKERLRRYWVSDRKPIVEREHEIRKWDIAQGPPDLHKRWGDVALMYLDPPYWKQTEGEYSDDPEDLANMPLDRFYDALSKFIVESAEKLHPGAKVALIISPTQWRAPDKRYPVDHVVDLIGMLNEAGMRYVRRIICPYESQQCNAQQVEWAKDSREVLVINREIIIWEIC